MKTRVGMLAALLALLESRADPNEVHNVLREVDDDDVKRLLETYKIAANTAKDVGEVNIRSELSEDTTVERRLEWRDDNTLVMDIKCPMKPICDALEKLGYVDESCLPAILTLAAVGEGEIEKVDRSGDTCRVILRIK